MARSIIQEIIDASEKVTVVPFFAVELLFDSPNELRFWSGIGDLTIDGDTYTGAGDLLKVSDVRESSDIAANGATLTMSGVPSDLISLAIDEPYQGRIAKIKFGLIDRDLLEDALLLTEGGDFLTTEAGEYIDLTVSQPANYFDLFVGYMDQMNIQEGPQFSTISISVESKLVTLEKPNNARYTDNYQQSQYSGDLAFEFVNRIQDEDLTWTIA